MEKLKAKSTRLVVLGVVAGLAIGRNIDLVWDKIFH